MKVLITGGTGFIGRYFHELLTAKGHEITILDLVTPQWNIGGARFIRGDVRDPGALAKAVPGSDRVLHLAAAHHDFGISEATYYGVNETGSKLVGDAMDAAGVREACFYSSAAVYGDAAYPHDENAEPRPVGPYGGSKLAGERAWRAWTERNGADGARRRCLVIRPTITFGPRNFANMYSLIRQIARGRFVQVGEMSNIKSISYVENIVAFTEHAWMMADRPDMEIFNWVEKPDMCSREIADQIKVSLGRKPGGLKIPMGLALLLALPFDAVIKLTGMNLPVSSMRVKKLAGLETKFEASKARTTGFVPKHSLAEGIDRMVKWYISEGQNQQAVWHQPPAEVVRT